MAAPALLFLATLTVMLLRPPDLQFYGLDRVAFVLLVMVAVLRASIVRQPMWKIRGVTLPMLGLLSLAFFSIVTQPFEAQSYSLVAAKFVVPFGLFYASMLVFSKPASLRWLETFALVVLAYLSFIAIAFLIGAKALIFPAFILDEGLGIHADRARGPFLQAVANGLTLNMLGLIALDSFRRGRLRGIWAIALLGALPVAILATRTRAVWLSFSLAIVVVCFRTASRKLRRACLCIGAMSSAVLVVVFSTADLRTSLEDRASERGPVEIRLAVYQAGWQMFLERPISGWGMNQMPAELASRMRDYRLKAFPVHNTYLEILVEHGIVGLGLYLWLVVGLFRIGHRAAVGQEQCAGNIPVESGIAEDDSSEQVVNREFRELDGRASNFPDDFPDRSFPDRTFPDRHFPDQEFRKIWPILLGVYLLNATFVVMNYQFVNGLLFTLAGVLAAQNRRAVAAQEYLLAS